MKELKKEDQKLNKSPTFMLRLRLHKLILDNSSVIRRKCESQNGCHKKTKHARFSEKQTVLTP